MLRREQFCAILTSTFRNLRTPCTGKSPGSRRPAVRGHISQLEERLLLSAAPWFSPQDGDLSQPPSAVEAVGQLQFQDHPELSDHLCHEQVHHGEHLHALPPVDESLIETLPADPFATMDLAATASGATLIDSVLAPLTDTFSLHSNAGANHTIYLDFNGHTTSGTYWNSSFNGGQDIVTAAYDFDGNASTFSDAELQRIQYIWQRVAEDFIPFDVNVTTEDPGVAALSKSGSDDAQWGSRVVIGGSSYDWYGAGAGGVAYVGSFNWSSDTPVFVFEAQLGNGAEKYTAEAISHEAGHALGLRHDGASGIEYYQGHGSGDTGWAPIMGNSYYKTLTQWSQGEYAGANNTQNDLSMITSNNGFGYRADDHGDSPGSASSLIFAGSSVSGSGLIEQNTDVDVFHFTAEAGDINLTIDPFARGANLDILAELYDTASNLISWANPTDLLGATISTTVTAGQYFLRVSGTGKGDPAGTGYSDYGSLGQYSISGNVIPSNDEYLSIAPVTAEAFEGDSGTTALTFTVTRAGNTSGATTVDYAVTGSGTNQATAADFAGGAFPTGTLSFAAGEITRTLTVAVVGDTQIEPDETFAVQLSNASGTAQITSGTATGTILNDDLPVTPGVTVTPTSGLTTRESGTTASFTVVLESQPTADVVIQVVSLDTSEGEVSTGALTFTSTNWDTAQTVTVTGLDDTVRDGQVTYTIELTIQSTDSDYASMDPDDVSVTNQDNEKGGKKGGGRSKPNNSSSRSEIVNESSTLRVAEVFSRWGAGQHAPASSATRAAIHGREAAFGQLVAGGERTNLADFPVALPAAESLQDQAFSQFAAGPYDDLDEDVFANAPDVLDAVLADAVLAEVAVDATQRW